MRNMHTTQAGSAIIIVILISALLVSSITVLWRSAHHMYDIACLRQRSYQIMYSAHACMRLAIAVCCRHYERCYAQLNTRESVVLESVAWPVDNKTVCHALVYAQRVDHNIQICVRLFDEHTTCLYTVMCIVECTDGEHPTAAKITQWRDVHGS